MQYTIQIPKPCHEPWEAMTPESNGRHCAHCSKTVVDFTGWQQEDIYTYLDRQGSIQVCGRFKEEQLGQIDTGHFISSVAYSPLPLIKKIAAIFLLAFGLVQMSCNIDTHAQKPFLGETMIKVDTPKSKTENIITGAIAPPPEKQKHKHKHVSKTQDTTDKETYKTGKLEYVPNDTTQK